MITLLGCISVVAQTNDARYPKEVRGYKVHRTQVALKKNQADSRSQDYRKSRGTDEYDEDEPLLIRLGEPTLVGVSPFGVTFDIPVILSAVQQQGEVERLVFEDMRVNDTPVTLDDYDYKFKLPNKGPLTLTPPIRIFVSTPQAVLRTIDEIFNSREVWLVTGRIYVCGNFKKFLLKFKRAIPVDVQTSITNPLR
jgi:hypothetical protein